MNRRSHNKIAQWWQEYAFPVCVAISYLMLVSFGAFFRFFYDGKWNITHMDARIRYASSIDSEIITDWDNPLIQKISIIIKHACSYVWGERVEGIAIINWAAAISLIALALIFAALLFFLVKKSKLYTLCLLPFSLFSFYTTPNSWSNTTFFIPLLFLTISFEALYLAVSIKWLRALVLLILVFSVILLIDCRRNAIFVVPVLVFWIISNTSVLSVYSKLAVAGLLSAIFYVFATAGIGLILDVKESHPTSPMLISDMVVACCLEDRLDDYSNPYVLYPDNHPCCDRNKLRAYCWEYEIGCLSSEKIQEVENRYGKDWHNWERFVEFYKREWREHTKAMLVAKLIQCEQFYMGFYMPAFLKNSILDSFPLLEKQRPDALNMPRQPFYRIFMRLMSILSMLVIPWFIYFKRRQKLLCSLVYQTIYYSSIVAFLYACSFIIVTPMPLERYLMPSIYMATAIVSVYTIMELSGKH